MSAFLQELIHTGIYKRSQGRITRQVTFAAVAVALAMGSWRLSLELEGAAGELLPQLEALGPYIQRKDRPATIGVISGKLEGRSRQSVVEVATVRSGGYELPPLGQGVKVAQSPGHTCSPSSVTGSAPLQ